MGLSRRPLTLQKYCRTGDLCGVCSGKHPFSQCIETLRTGNNWAARCPSCGGSHHAWFKGCPKRLWRLPPRPSGAIDTLPLKNQAVSQAAPPASPPSPSPSMDVVDAAPATASPPTLTPQQEDASTQTCRKRKGRPCQTTPPPTEDAVVQMTPETETQATQTSPETTNQDTQTPSTTTMDAETSALYPSTLVKPPTPVWNEVFAPSVTPTRMDLLTLCNALVTLWKEYDEDENNYDSLESPIRTVMFETLSAALRFRRPDYPRKCPRKDPARDALWPK